MSNFGIKIDLMKLKNAKHIEKSSVGECIAIPIEDNKIFKGKDGAFYLDLAAWESNNDFSSHGIKQQKSVGENLPFVGNMKFIGNVPVKVEEAKVEEVNPEESNDMPF